MSRTYPKEDCGVFHAEEQRVCGQELESFPEWSWLVNKLGSNTELYEMWLLLLSHTVSAYTFQIKAGAIDFTLTEHLGDWAGPTHRVPSRGGSWVSTH